MKSFRIILAAILSLFIGTTNAWAQHDSNTVEMADTMRSNGKIFVVVAVMTTILAGMILYLVRIDRRVSRLEKEND